MKIVIPILLLVVMASAELPALDDYIIGPDDVLRFWFFHLPADQSFTQPVRFDGYVTLPYLGEVKATGLTVGEFNRQIVRDLAKYVTNPDMAVSIEMYNSCKVYVLGQVAKPGLVSYRGRVSLVEVLTLAGGYTNTAVQSSVLVIRGTPGGSGMIIRVDVEKILKKGMAQLDIQLARGDIVYVPRSFIGDLNDFLSLVTPAVDIYLRVLYPNRVIIGSN